MLRLRPSIHPRTVYPKCEECPPGSLIRHGPTRCYHPGHTVVLCDHHAAVHRRVHLSELQEWEV